MNEAGVHRPDSHGTRAKQWRVFAFAEGGVMAWLLGKDKRAESVAPCSRLFGVILSSCPRSSVCVRRHDA